MLYCQQEILNGTENKEKLSSGLRDDTVNIDKKLEKFEGCCGSQNLSFKVKMKKSESENAAHSIVTHKVLVPL